MSSLLSVLLDRLFIRRRIEAESRQAVHQLKQVLLERQEGVRETTL